MKYLVIPASLQSDWDDSVNCFVIPAEDIVKIIEQAVHLQAKVIQLEETYKYMAPSIELYTFWGEFTYLDYDKGDLDIDDGSFPKIVGLSEDFEFSETEQTFKTQTFKVGKDRVYFKAWGKHTGEEAWAAIDISELIGRNSYYQKQLLMEDSMD